MKMLQVLQIYLENIAIGESNDIHNIKIVYVIEIIENRRMIMIDTLPSHTSY